MPAISKIRFTNVVYENGEKRYNDDIFQFDGHNGAILLENGGGKTVFVQTAIQAVLPHAEVAERKIKDTLMLENGAAHIAIEWILNEIPRRYALTAVTIFLSSGGVASYKYVYEYDERDKNSIENMPCIKESSGGKRRPATKEEMSEYYSDMSQNHMNAHTFSTITAFHDYIEDNFKIIPSEWRKIALINGAEGGVEDFFDGCKTTGQLVDRLLIPVVEEALAGNGTADFADTFEKQREHFKKHKQLRARIEESKRVEEQVGHFVKVFDIFNNANNNFISCKEKAKAIYRLTEKEAENNEKQLIENKSADDDLIAREKNWNQKSASYDLAVLKEQLMAVEKRFIESKEKYDEIKSSFDEKGKRAENIQLARHKSDIAEQEEKISYLFKKIQSLDEDEDIQDLKESLIQNSSELRGYFLEEEQKLKKDERIVQSQIARVEENLEACLKELENASNKEVEVKSRLSSIETAINHMNVDMEGIAREILSNPLQETVEEELAKWKERVVELEQSSYKYGEQLNRISVEKDIVSNQIPLLRGKLETIQKQETISNEKLKIIDEEHDRLLVRLKEYKSSWDYFDSIYLKQATILSQLESNIEILREEKEDLISRERLSNRFFDDYKANDYYTAVPQLERWITGWANQFNLLESGTRYVKRAASITKVSSEELYRLYPYWSATVIVSENEVGKLIDRLNRNVDEIVQPVIVITETEARSILNGNQIINIRNVIPGIWKRNITSESFEDWKREIEVRAKESTDNRIKKENDYNAWKGLLQDLRNFLDKHPYEEYTSLQSEIKNLKEQVNNIFRDIQAGETRIKSIDDEIEKYRKVINENTREGEQLSQKILRANEYNWKKTSKLKSETEKYKLSEELKSVQEEVLKYKNKKKSADDLLEDLKDSLKELGFSLRKLQGDEFYSEVINASPRSTSLSKSTLIQQRKDLKDALGKRQRGRDELQRELSTAEGLKEKFKTDLDNFRNQIQYEANEDFILPVYAVDELARLLEELKKLKKPVEVSGKDFKDKEKEFGKINNTYELRKQDYYKIYSEIIEFNQNLLEVNKLLEDEKVNLKKHREYIEGEKERLNNEKKNLDDIVNLLRAKNERYGYLSSEIRDITLDEGIVLDYQYKKKEFISNMIEELDGYEREAAKQNEKVLSQQQQFVKFCESQIYDIKLREMAVTGVRNKKYYKDIIEWQQRMNERISRTIEIAENDMREHDKEVQQFINQLHSYLSTLAQELRMIPKKTKIKVEDSWKEIFIFNVPEWDEKKGKEELAKYIDWMLKQLDGEQYKDESGAENDSQIRKAIERWMQSKQLLQYVMNQNTIKVKCRKVTNNGKISSMPFGWEESNSWSGGEKWSKNMTLFLGILNYLAEKRKQISSQHKRHRTVIVDNPFGKASSDHVLDPVFFIAEQLGFQIIALTAHSEGKFIRTYFPIVYSCRLRESKNKASSIITMEREIRTAFFKDNDPQVLLRLGQYQQMDLFDFYTIK